VGCDRWQARDRQAGGGKNAALAATSSFAHASYGHEIFWGAGQILGLPVNIAAELLTGGRE
jgi:hypothetical protein